MGKNYRYRWPLVFITIFLLCSIPLLMPSIEGSRLNNILTTGVYKNNSEIKCTIHDSTLYEQFDAILNFLKLRYGEREYEFIMKNLGNIQREYFGRNSVGVNGYFNPNSIISHIEALEKNNVDGAEKAKMLINGAYSAINSIMKKDTNENKKNTEDYYKFRLYYLIGRALSLGTDLGTWIRVVLPILLVLSILIIVVAAALPVFVPGVSAPDVLLMAVGALSVIIGYVGVRYYVAWLIAINSIDITLYITDRNGNPLNGLTVTARPWDNEKGRAGYIEDWDPFYGEQPLFDDSNGMYLIPLKHVPKIDVPPGIFDFYINGTVNGNRYSYSFDNSEEPISSGGRYTKVIVLEPEA